MSHIAEARARAEARLGSRGTIARPGDGPTVIDDDTGAATPPDPIPVHTGLPCSVTILGDQRANPELAGVQLAGQRYEVATTVDATGVQRGWTFTVTEVDEDGDPDLVGVPLVIDEVPHRSKVVLRRLICVDTRATPGRVP